AQALHGARFFPPRLGPRPRPAGRRPRPWGGERALRGRRAARGGGADRQLADAGDRGLGPAWHPARHGLWRPGGGARPGRPAPPAAWCAPRPLLGVMVGARPPPGPPAARGQVLAVLPARHGEEDVTVLTQDAVVATFSQILSTLTLALGAIAAVSLSVAGIGI